MEGAFNMSTQFEDKLKPYKTDEARLRYLLEQYTTTKLSRQFLDARSVDKIREKIRELLPAVARTHLARGQPEAARDLYVLADEHLAWAEQLAPIKGPIAAANFLAETALNDKAVGERAAQHRFELRTRAAAFYEKAGLHAQADQAREHAARDLARAKRGA